MNKFKRFITYLNERSPLAALSFLSAGICLSGMAFDRTFDLSIFILGIFFNNLLFIQMRLGDELKDFETDKVINPTRPLPRGILSTIEVINFLYLFLALLIITGAIIAAVKSPLAGIALIIAAVFSWLMYKEFYIGHELDKKPMLYALSHQVIVFPIFAWPGLLANSALIDNKVFLGWLLANFGASFTFEVCRKLDPNAHKLAKTYAHHYGRNITVLICAFFMGLSAVGACIAGFAWGAIPVLLVLFAVLLLWRNKPEKYKLPAGISALSSAVILWSPAVIWLIQTWRTK